MALFSLHNRTEASSRNGCTMVCRTTTILRPQPHRPTARRPTHPSSIRASVVVDRRPLIDRNSWRFVLGASSRRIRRRSHLAFLLRGRRCLVGVCGHSLSRLGMEHVLGMPQELLDAGGDGRADPTVLLWLPVRPLGATAICRGHHHCLPMPLLHGLRTAAAAPPRYCLRSPSPPFSSTPTELVSRSVPRI